MFAGVSLMFKYRICLIRNPFLTPLMTWIFELSRNILPEKGEVGRNFTVNREGEGGRELHGWEGR